MEEAKKLSPKEQEINVKLKQMELRHKRMELTKWKDQELQTDDQRVQIDKVQALADMLGILTIDAEKTLLGSEPVYKNVFDEKERKIIKEKIFEILKKI